MSAEFTTRPEILGTFGVVTSTHWLASAAGMGILERGGNAFDAAVATGVVLQIVEPHLTGPGGEVPIILHRAGDETPRVLCGQGVAPASATIDRFSELGLKMVPGTGFLPAVVPGAFDAWMLLLRDYGSLTLEEVLSPAIGYAERGFPVVPRVAEAVAPLTEFFKTEQGAKLIGRMPRRRIGQPEDLDGVLLLLASDASRFITGALIPVDDGQIYGF